MNDTAAPTIVVAGQRPTLRRECAQVWARWELLVNLVSRDLTVRYKRSLLGFLWSFLHPLIFMAVLTLVFGTLFAQRTPNYSAYLLSAYLAFQYFLQTTTKAMASMSWNGPLLKRIYVPTSIFPLSVALSGLVNLFLSFLPMFVVMAVAGVPFSWSLLFLPVGGLLLFVFVLGCSLGLCSLAVYFDDVRLMYEAGIYSVMYLTPIFYPLEIVPERFRPIIFANPLYYFCELIRQPVFTGRLPGLETIAIAAVWAVGMLFVGWQVLRRMSPGFFRHL